MAAAISVVGFNLRLRSVLSFLILLFLTSEGVKSATAAERIAISHPGNLDKHASAIDAAIGKIKKKGQLLVGFALETDNEIENAGKKLKSKNLDIIVLNSLNEEGAGFGHDTNKITLIDRNNIIDKFELKSKEEAAKDILKKVISMIQ
jgi:hypothetical protein